MITNTEEQNAIIAAARDTNDSIIVNARAGSGKTKTLRDLVGVLRGSTLITSFNKAIQEELTARITPTLSFEQKLLVEIRTAHSVGLSAFRRSGMRPETQSGKMAFLLKDQLRSFREDDDIHRNARHIRALAAMAKNWGFGITSSYEQFPSISDKAAWSLMADHMSLALELEGDTDIEQIIDEAMTLLLASNARIATIDFDDMIYLPLLKNLNIQQYDNVAIDEAQDINPTRRELMFRSMRDGGRMIAVGDPNQAIYGFTGADVASLSKIRDRAGAIELALTICWRCDEAIIREAQKIVPDIKARPGADAGQFVRIFWDKAPDPQGARQLGSQAADFLSLPQPGDAILCRLNKPNVAVALGLLRRGIPARIEGKDLGKRLLDHVRKAAPMHQHQGLEETLLDLDTYKTDQLAMLYEKKKESMAAMLQDELEAAELVIERVIEEHTERNSQLRADNIDLVTDLPSTSFQMLEQKMDNLFGDKIQPKNVVTLSSLHKAKGREWPRVFILGRDDYMPFHLARKAGGWQLDQEYNLMYVGDTRAERILVHVNGVASAIDRGLHREAPRA